MRKVILSKNVNLQVVAFVNTLAIPKLKTERTDKQTDGDERKSLAHCNGVCVCARVACC